MLEASLTKGAVGVPPQPVGVTPQPAATMRPLFPPIDDQARQSPTTIDLLYLCTLPFTFM